MAEAGKREGLVLLLSALVVVGGAAVAQRAPEVHVAASASAAPIEPPPLPSGAPLEALPTEDERAAGCHFADRGFGEYGGWRKLPLGRALIAPGRGLDADGGFRLLLHFHGAEPVRKQLAPEGFGLVIAAVDAGVGSHAYERALEDAGAFDRLVAAIEAEVAAVNGIRAAKVSSIVLTSWSAGYGAVTRILEARRRVDAVVLLDSLYAGFGGAGRTLVHGQLAAFVAAADAARTGGPSFVLTHTEIATPGYASTGEVATFLLKELAASATLVNDGSAAAGRFPLMRLYQAGRLELRGYAGADRDAHCAQLHLLPAILRDTVLPAL